MPRDLFAGQPSVQSPRTEGPRDLFAAPATPNFLDLFEEYRSGNMNPAKVPAFEELLRRRMPRMFHDRPIEPSKSGVEIAQTAVSNLPGSLVEEGKNLAQAIAHPIDTATALGKVGAGALSSIAGDYPSKTEADVENEQYWQTVQDAFIERYGTREGFLKAVQEEPASVLMDLAGLLTLGGTMASKIPGMAKASQVMTDIGSALDPIALAGKGVSTVAGKVGKGATRVTEEALGITTGVGRPTIQMAKDGGRSLFTDAAAKWQGKDVPASSFTQAMRGDKGAEDLIIAAKKAMGEVREQRKETFSKGLKELADDATELDTTPILEDVADIIQGSRIKLASNGSLDFSDFTLRGGDAKKLEAVIQKTLEMTGEGTIKPAELFNFKRLLETFSSSEPQANEIVKRIKGSIDEALNEAPGYRKFAKEDEAIKALSGQFEQSLGLKEGVSPDQVLRKLLAIGADDTGFKQRLLKELEDMTGTSLSQEIAGVQMKGLVPKAMLSRAAGGAMLYGGMQTNTPLLALLAASASPRAIGEMLRAYGYSRNTVKQVVNALKKTGAFDSKVSTTGALAGRANEEESK